MREDRALRQWVLKNMSELVLETACSIETHEPVRPSAGRRPPRRESRRAAVAAKRRACRLTVSW